jgi:hypothetical protein
MRVMSVVRLFCVARFALALRFLACTLVSIVAAGCTASIQGAPPRVFPVDTELVQVRDVLNRDWYGSYATSSDETHRRYYRDQAVLARMYAIDIAYSKYELDLTRERQNVGFLSTLTLLGLTTAGTLVGGAETKTILSATATGVTGTKEAYDKNVLVERTISVLQQQMRAQRKFVKVKIIERLRDPTSNYPLEFALSDVEEYYRAGTITGALIGASQDAGATLTRAEVAEQEVFVFKFSRTDLSPRIERFFLASDSNQEKVERWLVENGFRGSLNRFLTTEFADLQLKMVRELPIPE